MKYLKKFLKISMFFLVAIGFILFCLYIYHDKELPEGKKGVEADQLAKEILNALNHDAYKELDYIEWGFSRMGKEHKYQWYKNKGRCTVLVDSVSVDFNTLAPYKSKVKVNGKDYHGEKEKAFIRQAEAKFNNDSFWVVAPYKLFDAGVERRLVQQQNGNDALLVTYTSGGSTPGDSYLWILDEHKKPIAFQMWVKIIPLGGLNATWEEWISTTNGAYFPQKHKILGLEIDITNIKAY